MKRLSKFRHLSTTEQAWLLTAVLLLAGIRLGLWLLPFRIVRRLLAGMRRLGAPPQATTVHTSIATVMWAVTVASKQIPGATCLTQALGAQVLLGWQGHATTLHIGVARTATGPFQAHAWVECQGKVVIGGPDAPLHFTPLQRLEGHSW